MAEILPTAEPADTTPIKSDNLLAVFPLDAQGNPEPQPISRTIADVVATAMAEGEVSQAELDAEAKARTDADKEINDRLNMIPLYPARLSIWPPNVAMHSDFQRSFKAVLNELNEQVLRIDGGSTGTHFVNRFQIKTRNADRAEVLLHSQGWSYTAEGAQELEWDVSADEFNQLGTSVSTDYIEVWGEFRALYGGGVDELRGRTQSFVIGFGEEADWPSTRGDVAGVLARSDQGDDLQSITIGSLASYNAAIAAQAKSDQPLELVFATTVVLFASTAREETYNPGDVVRYAPRSVAPERRFNVVSHTDLGKETTQRQEGDTVREHNNVSTEAELTAALNTHANDDANHARLIVIAAAFSTATRSYAVGQRWYIAPNLHSEGDLILFSEAGKEPDLPPFVDIRLLPEAVPGSQVPDDIYVELAGKLTAREIDGLTLTIQGTQIQPHASTPVSGFDTETQAFVRFDVSAVADAIANGLSASDRTAIVDLTFSFTEGDDFTRRILLPVNNPNAPRLVQGELDSITFNAATTLDWLAPDMRTITVTEDITFTFSNIQIGRPLVVEVVQNATGGNGITWPASVEWAGKVAQGPTAAGNARDIFTLLPLAANRVLASAALNVGSP